MFPFRFSVTCVPFLIGSSPQTCLLYFNSFSHFKSSWLISMFNILNTSKMTLWSLFLPQFRLWLLSFSRMGQCPFNWFPCPMSCPLPNHSLKSSQSDRSAFCHYWLDSLWRNCRTNKQNQAVPLFYRFSSSPEMYYMSISHFTLAPVSLVRVLHFTSSFEFLEVSLCGVVLFGFRYIEHAFVFKNFALT